MERQDLGSRKQFTKNSSQLKKEKAIPSSTKYKNKQGSRVGLVVRALAFHQCGPGFKFRTRRHVWIGFVGSLLCYERFFPGYSGFPLSSKTNISPDLIC